MFNKLREEIEGIMKRDPAVKSAAEVVFLYPSFKAVVAYRQAHWFYERGMFFIARFISQRSLHKTGIEIHPGAKIGKNLFIDHGTGVVIGETAEIGDNCTIYQNVTLGGTGKEQGKRHPTLGNNVMVGAGARVLGPFKVGNNSKIGANAVVLCEVPENSTVVGVPARVVRLEKPREWDDIDQVNFPDPQGDELESVMRELADFKTYFEETADTCGHCDRYTFCEKKSTCKVSHRL